MAGRVVVNLATGLEDAERVMIAFLIATAALEQGKSVHSRGLADEEWVPNARVGGATPLWEWAGDDATVFSY